MIGFDKDACADLDRSLTREWLETNGIGGFASSTITNLNTRRYHGLLIAATRPPLGRLLMLSKSEETLIVGERRYELSSNQYPGTIYPRGYEYQIGFRLDPFPIFTYRIENIEIEKTIFMIYGENSTVVQYEFRVTGGDASVSPVLFELRPLVAVRDYHSLMRENEKLNPQFHVADTGCLTFKPYEESPALNIAHDAERIEAAGYWYRNFEYRMEHERGFDFQEDLFCPVRITANVAAQAQLNIIASTETCEISRVGEYRRAEVERRCESSRAASSSLTVEEDALVSALVAASDAYIVRRGTQQTVIAGYPWFSDWGRDTMIALPGLTLVTKRFDIARSILTEFARHTSQGMIPNRFPDAGETPEYNTVDATLWFFEATRALLQYTNDYEFVRANLYHTLTDIIRWHERGTRYRIRVDADGLLAAGEPGVQLTWMDAKVGDWVVTPRTGKAVEIQALWYNALRVIENLAEQFEGRSASRRYAEMAEAAHSSFNELFWNDELKSLYDVVDGAARDASVRPNQIFAVSLKHSMLSLERARSIVQTVESMLLTPYGLRSLAPQDKRYQGVYEGAPLSRDGAYHQGTVWAWLMGAFLTAYVKVSEDQRQARERAKSLLTSFHLHLSEAGLGHVSEIFDGDTPHTPRGAPAQAWSVAELLRAAIEDAYGREDVDRRQQHLRQ